MSLNINQSKSRHLSPYEFDFCNGNTKLNADRHFMTTKSHEGQGVFIPCEFPFSSEDIQQAVPMRSLVWIADAIQNGALQKRRPDEKWTSVPLGKKPMD
jgi:hypothetical protein